MLSPQLLEILCCPETHQDLQLADAQLLAKINQLIAAGQVRNRAGQIVPEAIDAALVRSDRQVFYPVRGDIPVMLIDESIPMPM